MNAPVAKALASENRELLDLLNLGPATLGYLRELGIDSVPELARQDADDLYVGLQHQRGIAFDPCLHDVFVAVILEARTGERRPWHEFTSARKDRQNAGEFNLRAPGPSLRTGIRQPVTRGSQR